MSLRIAVGVGIVLWTLAAWGGRIGLLAEGEADAGAWVRIAGSILVGVVAGAAIALPGLEWLIRPAVWVFVVWTAVLWTRSLYVNWTGSGSLPFKIVHTVLAIGFAVLGWLAFAQIPSTGGDSVAGPDESHSQEQT